VYYFIAPDQLLHVHWATTCFESASLKMPRPLLLVDSGSGGFSVLEVIQQRLSGVSYTYAADYAGCPYGDRSVEQIVSRVMALVKTVQSRRQHGLIVVACNTASTLLLDHLRIEYSIPVVGVVPAIKPACASHPGGNVLLLATPQTAHGAYLDRLESQFSNGAHVQRFGSTELVRLAEQSLHSGEDISAVAAALGPLGAKQFDAVVLGCTHFPLLKTSLQRIFSGAEIVDSSRGIAERVAALAENRLDYSGDNAFYVTAQFGPPQEFLERYGLSEARCIPLRGLE
jgi:glutamate racemase